VQAQLHRVGFPCGPIDGLIGERTLSSIQALGLKGMKLEEIAVYLSGQNPPQETSEARKFGYVVVPGRQLTAQAYGKLGVVRTPQGYSIAVDGPGRFVLDVGDAEPV
jgi:hypothetical protein